MLIVLQTQFHIHQQPDADFLLTNPQAGYQQLLTDLKAHHVQLSGRTRIGVLPHSQEEWLEDAAWIKAGLDYAKAHQLPLLILQLQSGANQYYDFRQDKAVSPKFLMGDDLAKRCIMRFGGDVKYIGTYDDYRHLRQNEGARYNLDPVFLQHSGRLVDTFKYDQDSAQSFYTQVLFRLSSLSSIANHSDVFVKSQAAKRFKDRFTHDEITSALNDSDKYSEKFEQLMYSSQVHHSFIISNFIPMHDEHRFFVVANKIIDGARTTGSDTPVKHDVLGYQQNMRRYAGHVNQELYHFACKMVQEIAATSKKLSNQPYVIDVAYESTFRQPVIVELNPFFNAGLYATNPRLLIDALFQ